MTVVTSKISPVVIGQGRNKETIYTATRTTKLADGTYDVEMLQYSDAKGAGGRVIAERDGVNNWNFKNTASKKVKQNQGRLNQASKNQMESMRGDFVKKSQDTEEYNRAKGEPNRAEKPPESGDTSQPSSVPPKEPKNRDKFGNFRYPLTTDETADVIKFDMMKYEPKRFKEGLSFSDRSSDRDIIGTVVLPIPAGIQDQNSCSWGPGNMDAVQIAGSDFAKAFIGGGVEGAKGSISRISSGISKGRGDVQEAITNLFAASASGINPNELLSRTEGVILNPNLELLFNAPSLRPFSFTFKMSPRSADEAKEIVQIIRFFKQGMAPIREGTRLFLKTPNTFKIQYQQLASNSASPFLNKFKECALTSCSVQYTPEGSYAPFEDGAMSSYSMTLAFQELEPVYSDDYEESDSSSSSNEVPAEIGF